MEASLAGSELEVGLPAFFHFLNDLERAVSAFASLLDGLGVLGFVAVFVSKASLPHLTRRFEKRNVKLG